MQPKLPEKPSLLHYCCVAFDVPVAHVLSSDRARHLSYPRYMFAGLMTESKYSLTEIARLLNRNRKYSAAYWLDKHHEQLSTNKHYAQSYKRIKEVFYGKD